MYGWLSEHANEERLVELDKLIFDPPGGMTKEAMAELPEWQPENIGQDFMAQFGDRFTTLDSPEDVV